MQKIFKNYIGGDWVESATGKLFHDINPSVKSEILAEFQFSGEKDIDLAVDSAGCAFSEWKKVSAAERINHVEKFLKILEENREQLGRIVSLEEGKTLKESQAEISSAMLEGKHALRKYATLTDAASEIKFSSGFGMTMTCPLGVVVIISPWNYPVNVMCRKALPAIISGNTVVFKPATFTPWSGIFMAELFDKSGIPGGVFNCVTGKGGALGERLVSHPDVKAVSFTGSTEVGRKINTAAAKNFTRTQLELGGKNALIVDSDADLAKAAEAVIAAGYGCSGQWCTSTSRILLHRNVKEKFTDILLDKVRKIRVGNSIDPESDMGPVAGETQYNNTMKYIEVAKSEGAELLFGGDFRDDKKYSSGYFIPPTLFAEVTEDMTIFKEEIFGPVIGITEYSDFDEAIELMNASCYGLSSSIFTNNLSHAMEYVKRAETGLVHVNIHTGYKEPCLPFGGWKESGNGNPENGDEGIEFFTEKKAIYINT